jgi:ABC-2 type transport system ATP-binding protein
VRPAAPERRPAIVAGFDVARFPEAGARAHRLHVAEILALPRSHGDENLRFFGGVYGVRAPNSPERIRFAIGMAGLTGARTRWSPTLAGGWKQRLALGCAVLHRPAILFLDEPTSGVDPASRRRFWDLIHSAGGDGVTVLVSTHYMDEAEYCHRIAL